MIQRVQSIWLLLAALTLICLFFLPLLNKSVDSTEYYIYTSGIRQEVKDNMASMLVAEIAVVPIALNSLGILTCLAAIFLFRNRSLQKKIILLGILLIIAMTALAILKTWQLPGGIDGASLTSGTFLPVLAMIFCLLAIRGIRKDEQLLRSADRLR